MLCHHVQSRFKTFLYFSYACSGIVQAMMAMVNFCDNCLRKKEEGQYFHLTNLHVPVSSDVW